MAIEGRPVFVFSRYCKPICGTLLPLGLVFATHLSCRSSDLKTELAKVHKRTGLAIGTATTAVGQPTSLYFISPTGEALESRSLNRVLMGAQLSADGLAIVGRDGNFPGLNTNGSERLMVLDLHGKVLYQHLKEFGTIASIAYSAGSNTIAVSPSLSDSEQEQDVGFYLLNLEKQSETLVRLRPHKNLTDQASVRSLSWRADSRSVAFVRAGSVWSYDLVAESATRIADGSLCSWAPVGQQLAYVTGQGDIELINFSDGRRRTLLSKRNARGLLVFSPDGKYLLTGMPWGVLGMTYVVIVRVSDGTIFPFQRSFKGVGPDLGWGLLRPVGK